MHRRSRSPSNRVESPPRRKKKTQSAWDQPPTAEQAASQAAAAAAAVMGLDPNNPNTAYAFAMANTQKLMDYAMSAGAQAQLPALINAAAATSMGAVSKMNKQARRLYVGNLPDTTEQELGDFFNEVMRTALGNKHNEDTVFSVYIRMEKKFAFVEFNSPDLATAGMDLDGINFKGVPLKIKRPSDYNASLMSEGGTLKLDTSKLSIVSVSAKVFVGGFPPTLRELHVEEILNCFGKTKYFNLVRNKDGVSQGYGYAEWEDSTIVDYACAALNNIELGNHALTVRRADSSPPQVGLDLIMAAAEEAGIDLTRTSHGDGSKGAQDFVNESNVICLLQMVTRDDLLDDAEYKDILEDIRDECSAFGKVVSIEIPRPTDQYSDPVPGEGKVFVEFATINEALKAKNALQGRKFASRIVVAQCFNYNRYKQRDFV